MKTKTKLPAALAASLVAGLLLCAVQSGQAQDPSLRIDWFTVDAGGGATTGGGFMIQSTIGQLEDEESVRVGTPRDNSKPRRVE